MLTMIRAYGQKSMIDLPEYKSLLIMDLITLHMRHIDTHISASSNSTKGLNKYPSEMSVGCSGVLEVTVDMVESSPLLTTVRRLVFVEDSISVIEFTFLRSKLKVDEFSSPIDNLTLRLVVSPSVSGTMVEVFSW